MMKNLYFFAVLIILFIAPVSLFSQSISNSKTLTSQEIVNLQIDYCTDLENKPISFDNVTISDFLVNINFCSDIPMGAALLPDNQTKTYQLKPQSTRLKDVLDSITIAEPRYKWSIEDGVINLTPRTTDLPLLAVPIDEFQEKNSRIEYMFDKLEARAEVRQRAERLNLKYKEFKFYVSLMGKANLSLSCKNTNVRQVLNAIAKLRNTIWFYREYDYEKEKYYSFG